MKKNSSFQQFHLQPIEAFGLDDFLASSGGGVSLTKGAFQSPNYVKGQKGWKLDAEGHIYGVDIELTGGTIKYNKTSFTDSTNKGYHISSAGFYFGSAADASYIKYNIDTADFTLHGVNVSSPTLTNLQTGSEIAIQGWQQDMAFSSTDHDTIAWASGTITLLDGTTYNISAGNTGNMAAITYIYLDIGTSLTVLQTTTTAGTAVGSGKILIAFAKNSTTQALFQVYGGKFASRISGVDLESLTVDTAQLKNAAVEAAKIATNAVETAKVAADAITAAKIAVAGLDGITGDVATDHIVADMIKTNAVTSAKVLADAITAAKINVSGLDGTSGDVATNHIIAGMIQTNAITSVKILADAVTASKINVVGLDGTSGRIVVADATDANVVTSGINSHAATLIQAGKIVISGAVNLDNWSSASDATYIDGGKVYTNSITASQIAATTITANELATNCVTSAKILADAVTAVKINVVGLDGATGRIVVTDATDANVVTGGINSHATTLITAGKIVISGATNLDDWRKGGDLTMIDGGSISTNTITATQILGNTITASEIAANTITASEILGNTITASEIAANTITANEILGNTITAAEIGANIITANEISTGLYTEIDSNLPSDENLVGYWAFDEGAGSKAYDGSGNGNDGTLNNMEEADWVDGVAGSCLDFDGVNEYVNYGNDNSLLFTSEDFSVGFWLYPAKVNVEQLLFCRGVSNVDGWYIFIHSNTSIYVTTNQSGVRQDTSSQVISANVWQYITVVRSGASVKIYRNGEDITESPATHIDPVTNSRDLLIGIYDNLSSSPLEGKIDEVRIYNAILTAKETYALYKNPSGQPSLAVPMGRLTSGSIYSKQITLAVTGGTGDSYIAGKKSGATFDWANWEVDGGFMLGLDDSPANDPAKLFIGDSGGNFLKFDSTNFQVKANRSNLMLYEAVVDADGYGDYTTLGAAITAGKTRIYVREGTYIENKITLSNNNTVIVGESNITSVIYLENNTNDHLFYITGEYCQFYNLNINGNRGNNAGAIDTIQINGVNNCIIEDCWIYQSDRDGIRLVNADNTKINNNYIHTNDNDGIYIDANSSDTKIKNNKIYATIYGIYCLSTIGTIINNNNFETCSNAIYLYNAAHVQVNDNYIETSLWNAINLYSSDYCQIANNKILESGQQTDNYHQDIWIQETSSYNTIVGNHCFAYTAAPKRVKYNIFEAAGCDYNLVDGNTTIGAETDRILTNGGNTIEGNNIEKA